MKLDTFKTECTKLADTFVFARLYDYSPYFIILLMLVSGGTEFAFLYSDTISPLINNFWFAVGITALFVGVIEGLNYFGLRSAIIALKYSSWWHAVIIGLLIYGSAKIVSVSISIGGAIKAVEFQKKPPYEITPIYKDSIESYYNTQINKLMDSPRELNDSKVKQLQNMNNNLLNEINGIKNDKNNYISGELVWELRGIIKSKEKLIEKNRIKINDIISNNSGVANASKEVEKMRLELNRKLEEIKKDRKEFDSTIGTKNERAFYVIIIVEFFAFILNLLRTFTSIFKTRSIEEELLQQERDLKKEERKNIVVARMEKMILNKFVKGRISMNVARSEIGKLYGGNSINAERFKSMVKNHSKRSITKLNNIEQN